MSLVVKEAQSYPLITEGTHIAVCRQVIDLGHQYSDTYQKWSPKVRITWELPGEDDLIEVDGTMQGRLISSIYTASFSENANLRKTLEAWRGKKFTAEELQGFHLGKLIDVPCMVTITHSESNGKTYANVANVAAMPKGFPVPAPTTEAVIFDLDDFDALNQIDDLPEYVQTMIKKSQEWQNIAPAADDEDQPF